MTLQLEIGDSAEQQCGARTEFLPFALPSIGEEEIAEVVDTLRSGWVTTGPKVKRFESDFAAYVGAGHALAVNSCTAALHLALAALGVGPGDEVIVPTYTFCATANVVVHTGARPVLVDVGPDYQIDPAAAEVAVTPRTKAIMPVHFAGQPCDLGAIYDLAERHGLAVVEDAAHAAGAHYRGLKVGSDELTATRPSLRRATAFSFYANKNLTTGEGGMLTTSDPALAEAARTLSLHGMSKDAWKRYTNAGSWYYEVVAAGYKKNMTDIAAALGIHQLRRLDGFIARRRELANLYDAAFASEPAVITPLRCPGRDHAFHLYAVQLDTDQPGLDRARFIEGLRELGIGASVHFIPVHLHPHYRETFGYREGDLPCAELLYRRAVSLPLYPSMTDEDAHDVVRAVRRLVALKRS